MKTLKVKTRELKRRIYFLSHLLSHVTTQHDSSAKGNVKIKNLFTKRATKDNVQKYISLESWAEFQGKACSYRSTSSSIVSALGGQMAETSLQFLTSPANIFYFSGVTIPRLPLISVGYLTTLFHILTTRVQHRIRQTCPCA